MLKRLGDRHYYYARVKRKYTLGEDVHEYRHGNIGKAFKESIIMVNDTYKIKGKVVINDSFP